VSAGLDLAKNFFQMHGVDERGKAVLRKKNARIIWALLAHERDYQAGYVAAPAQAARVSPPEPT
jgi:hypothetical protein